jgi:hypothetical protein
MSTPGVPGGALPFSGPLDLAAINTEFGLGTDLTLYHGVRWYYDGNLTTGLFGGSTIKISDFYGKRATDPASAGSYYNYASRNILILSGNNTVNFNDTVTVLKANSSIFKILYSNIATTSNANIYINSATQSISGILANSMPVIGSGIPAGTYIANISNIAGYNVFTLSSTVSLANNQPITFVVNNANVVATNVSSIMTTANNYFITSPTQSFTGINVGSLIIGNNISNGTVATSVISGNVYNYGNFTAPLYRNYILIEIWGGGGSGAGGNGGDGSKGNDSSMFGITVGGGAGGSAGSIPEPPPPVNVGTDGRGGKDPVSSGYIGAYFNTNAPQGYNTAFINSDGSLTLASVKDIEAARNAGNLPDD